VKADVGVERSAVLVPCNDGLGVVQRWLCGSWPWWKGDCGPGVANGGEVCHVPVSEGLDGWDDESVGARNEKRATRVIMACMIVKEVVGACRLETLRFASKCGFNF
jgi:hypothetical protein